LSLVFLAIVIALVCAWASLQLFRHLPRGVAALLTGALVLSGLGIPGLLLGAVATEPRRVDVRQLGYETSSRCVKCHPDHHRSWQATYHRTMTQDVSPTAVLGDFDDAVVRYKGFEARMFRENDRFFMDVVDPKWEHARAKGAAWARSGEQRRTFQVDRLVGSHIEQVYLSRLDNGAYFILPFVWNVVDRAWLPINAIFVAREAETIHPEGYAQLWNSSCIFCHNTRPNPGLRPGASPANATWDVELPEMGIACEACHGPGEAHVAANHNLMRRQLLIETERRDRTIVNPERMRKLASVRTCGGCHGKARVHEDLTQQALEEGSFFIPGREDLAQLFELPMPRGGGIDPGRNPNYFWPDGTPRATAMEYQGTIMSPCFQRGKMTCVSCHSMHASDPSDQLRFPEDPDTPEHESDEQCTQCHPQFVPQAALVAHTRHKPESAGSLCVTCHMPYQSYGLLSAQRSHRIQNPDPVRSALTGLPNGCNTCHVDRSLRWTADAMAAWRGEPPTRDDDPLFAGDRSQLSETLLQLVQGHALSRAIAVQMLGREDAREAAPGPWRVPFLIDALADPYPTVRKNAHRSLRRQPGFEDAVFDYVADPAERTEQIAALRGRWAAMAREHADAVPATVPLATDGLLEAATISRLRAARDDVEMILAE
jgi:hypothetical protein